jgi:hypothetical protein
LYAECSLSCCRWWRRHSSFQGFFDKFLNANPGCPVNPAAADLSPTSHKVSGDTHVQKGVCFWTWRDCCVWFFSRARSSVLRRRSKLFAGRYRHIVYCIMPRRVHFRLALRIQLRVDQRAKGKSTKEKPGGSCRRKLSLDQLDHVFSHDGQLEASQEGQILWRVIM